MKVLSRTSLFVLAQLFLCCQILSANASEVLMITWQGELPSEIEFRKHLKLLHPDVKITHIDAQRQKEVLAIKLRETDLSKFDAIYSVSTTASKLVKNYVNGRFPHIFNIVATPVLSNIAASVENPGKNITGARFMVDFDIQIETLAKLKPIRRLAVWFNPREKQGNTVVTQIRKSAARHNIQVTAFRVIPRSAGFDKALSRITDKTNNYDAVYIVATTSYRHIVKQLLKDLKPDLLVMGTAVYYIKGGATVALGADLRERGQAGARIVSRVLKGEKPEEIPVNLVTKDKTRLYVNSKTAGAVGINETYKLGFIVKFIKVDN